jgi:peptide subunit release factor 1 (eRF1)
MSSQEENKKLVEDLLSAPIPSKENNLTSRPSENEKQHRRGGRSSLRFNRIRREREENEKKQPSNN